MRIALFGDIHANLEALEAVLEDASQQGRSECDEYFGPGVRRFLEENLPIPLERVRFARPVRTME